MRYLLIGLFMLCGAMTSAMAQLSIGLGFPGVSIGINVPVYPELVRVPGYPVYYAPRLSANFFFYDGLYWVYEDDDWYASSWYNGPWSLVDPWYVPVYVLRIPVRYYRVPPPYFHRWRADAPPHWGERWGRDWEEHRHGWDQWNRRAVPAPAPLPVYQQRYSRDRYPQQIDQQQRLRQEHYRYQPREQVVREHFQAPPEQRSPRAVPRGYEREPRDRDMRPQDMQRSPPNRPMPQQRGPDGSEGMRQQAPRHRGDQDEGRSPPIRVMPQQRGPDEDRMMPQPQQGSRQREQRAPMPSPREMPQQGMGTPQQEHGRGQGQGQGQGRGRDNREERDNERR